MNYFFTFFVYKFGNKKLILTFVKQTSKKRKVMTTVHTFQESNNTTWFCQFMPMSKEWMIWCERKGEQVRGTLTFRKRLNKEWKEMFNIK